MILLFMKNTFKESCSQLRELPAWVQHKTGEGWGDGIPSLEILRIPQDKLHIMQKCSWCRSFSQIHKGTVQAKMVSHAGANQM